LIRWDDKPNIRGGDMEKRIAGQFENRINWSGPHINTGKSWREQ